VGKQVQVITSLETLFSSFDCRATKLERLVANTIEIETVAECIFLHLSQCHFTDDQASRVFGNMAAVSGHLATILTSHWGRLKLRSDPHHAIRAERIVQIQQEALLKDLKGMFQYITPRQVVLHDAIALCFQIDKRQNLLEEEMMKSEGIREELTADSDPIQFFKDSTCKAGLFALARREGLEFGQVEDIPELSWTPEIRDCLVASLHS